MSWHFLQEQEAVSSEAISWDGERFAPSNGQTTLDRYCLLDSVTGSCRDSLSGMMSRPLTGIHGADESMSSRVDFLARIYPPRAKVRESMDPDPGCGSTWRESFARFDPDSSSWKTPQCSLLAGLDEFSETWPRWGMMRSGECSELPTWEHRTSGTAYGLLPTPLASIATHGGPNQHDSSGRPGLQIAAMRWATPQSRDFRSGQGSRWDNPERTRNLNDQVAKYSTPTVNDAKNSTLPPSQANRGSLVGDVMRNWPTPRAGNPGSRPNGKGGKILAEEVKKMEDALIPGGQLNPPWVEWLMGWPIEWTALKPLETAKFQQWRQAHSVFSAGDSE